MHFVNEKEKQIQQINWNCLIKKMKENWIKNNIQRKNNHNIKTIMFLQTKKCMDIKFYRFPIKILK